MDIETLREYCLTKEGSTESFPFGETNLVFKVNGKMFLLASLDTQPLRFNVKCDPEKAIELREQYDCIIPGYHMNKKYWNTIIIDGTLKHEQIKEFIDDSYELVNARAKTKK
jgi:predicted DNA-binding protein (MmcQ/YjbR family)